MSQTPKKCCYCGVSDTVECLRPYGPDRAPICFPCATETPEREAAARERMKASLEVAIAQSGNIVYLTEDGFVPGPLMERN